jgi:hypothetical protein
MRLFRPHRRAIDVRALLPLRHRLGLNPLTPGKSFQALLTLLDRSTHCRGRAGASV